MYSRSFLRLLQHPLKAHLHPIPTYERTPALTNRNAQFRPHCVDLAPGAFNRTGNTPNNRASRQYALAAEKYARTKPKARTAKLSGSAQMGAVRASAAASGNDFQHTGKLSVALVVVAGGILWTTTSIGKSNAPAAPSTFQIQPAIAQAVAAPTEPASPAFFFDDSSDALTDHLSANADKTLAIAIDAKPVFPSTAVDANPVSPSTAAIANVDDVIFDRTESSQVFTQPVLNEQPSSSTVTLSALAVHPSMAALRSKAIAPEGSLATTVAVASGNTLSGILNDHGVSIEQMPKLLTDELVDKYLTNLTIGQELMITQLAEGEFHSLQTRVGDDKRITIQSSDSGFAVASIDLPVEKERVVTSGTIEQSLYLAAEEANLKQSTIMELANIFQWELDFARDIRKGDQFALVYDRLYRDGSYIGDGDILAAEFMRGGKAHRAIRFTTDDGTTSYYSPDGQSMRRTFLRHPVDVVRITSKFNPNRMHPVLHKIRAHRGVDYGSPHGSPIYATADGTVKFAGSKNAYGKTVVLQHGQKFSTLYAHMSRISDKSKVGKRVKQGDVIGYVGKTGRVTGTHLHYEFRVNNEQIDPLKIELPAAEPIAAKYLPELRAISDEMTTQMSSVLEDIGGQVASGNDDSGVLVLNSGTE